MPAKSGFPDTAWDGSSASRPNTPQSDAIQDFRKPDAADWDQIVAEVVAVETLIVNNGGLGGGGGTTFTPVAPLDLTGGNLKLDNSTYAVPQNFAFVITGNATVVTDATAYHPILWSNMKFTRIDMYAAVPPIGADLIFDIEYSQDLGSTWTSLWPDDPDNLPNIIAGTKYNSASVFDTNILNAGTIFRLNVTQIGSDTAGAAITVQLSGLVPFPSFGGSPP